MFILPEKLEDDLVILKPLQKNDFERLYKIASDPDIWELHPESNRYERSVFQTFFDSAIASEAAFLIFDNATGELIGATRFYDYDSEKSQIAIGYTFLTKEYWGGPYNKAVKTLMLNYAFQFVANVIFHIGAKNYRSQKGTEKIGAKRTQPIKIDPDVKSSDNYVYVISRDDWKV